MTADMVWGGVGVGVGVGVDVDVEVGWQLDGLQLNESSRGPTKWI